VCELIPSFNGSLYSSSSITGYLQFLTNKFCVLADIISLAKQNAARNWTWTCKQRISYFSPACRQDSFFHLRFAVDLVIPSGKFHAGHFAFFLPFSFQIYIFSFFSLSFLFFRFRCLKRFFWKTLSHKPLFTAASPDSPINELFAFISCPEVFRLRLAW